MKQECSNRFEGQQGFSLVELIISLILTVIILGGAAVVYNSAISTRERESGRVDALTAAQAALSVMSREIGNGGYGLDDSNGIVLSDSGAKQLRVRANIDNTNNTTSSAGEDLMYLYDSASQSVVRHDRNDSVTSGIINRVSDVDFEYHNYDPITGAVSVSATPSVNTAKVTIKLKVILPDVTGQPTGRVEQVTSDVTMRNAPYVLGKY